MMDLRILVSGVKSESSNPGVSTRKNAGSVVLVDGYGWTSVV
jgi:hypothetical protein